MLDFLISSNNLILKVTFIYVVIDPNLCEPVNPCQHGGICSDELGDFNCNCTEGWEGHNCSIGMKQHNILNLA